MRALRYAVLMPAYNAEGLVDRALASVHSQLLPVDEVIVVDDGSRDGTALRAEAWADRLPLKLLRNAANAGITASLRRGAEAASAQWVLRLDADDVWLPSHVQALEQAIARAQSAVLVSASAWLVGPNGDRLGLQSVPTDSEVRARLMWDNPLIHSATGFRRDAYLRAGGYPRDVRWEDYPLWIRLLTEGQLASAPEPTMAYTVAPHSLSRVRRHESLLARWVCQREAIATFWRQHPATALGCLTAGGLRIAWSRLRDRSGE